MATYRIGRTEWELWRGPPPLFVQEQVEHFVRVGTDGVGIQTLGLWAPPFEVELESHHQSFQAALRESKRAYDLGRQVVRVVFDGVDYYTVFKTEYAIDRVQLVDCRAVPRLIGPGYDYQAGGRLVMIMQLTPIPVTLSPPTPAQ